MFYNTINLEGEELKKERANVLKQEELISLIFEKNPQRPISPSEILEIFQNRYGKNIPITSIRRGITNLSTDNEKIFQVAVLLKTPVKIKGLYHLPEHCWIWKKGNEDKGIEKMPDGISFAEFVGKIASHVVQRELFK